MVRGLTRKILEEQGYRVIDAEDGLKACIQSQAFEGEIDLLLSDVIMPNLNGHELYQELLKTRPGLKVLFMSGYTDDIIGRHGILDKGTRLIKKPFSGEQLVRAVRDELDE